MDLATVGGLGGGFALIVAAIVISGNSLSLFVDPTSFVVVILGSFAACTVAVPLERALGCLNYIKITMNVKVFNKRELIDQLVQFADSARKEGLLSLDDALNDVENDFLRSGLRLVVDGTDPDIIKKILYADIGQIQGRHDDGIKFIELWAGFAPAFGMIGTLLGLVGMMANLEDTASVGPNMAVALITTLYGSVFANLVLMPIQAKLEGRDKEEMIVMEMMVQGILSIQSGDNPNLLKEKLEKFLPPHERDTGDDAGAGE
jgi:chemotaxis protein MotA